MALSEQLLIWADTFDKSGYNPDLVWTFAAEMLGKIDQPKSPQEKMMVAMLPTVLNAFKSRVKPATLQKYMQWAAALIWAMDKHDDVKEILNTKI